MSDGTFPSPFVLEMREITRLFPGAPALERMHLDVRPATVHTPVDENGAGKSMLFKVLRSQHSPTPSHGG
jgi:ABC-type sugar transport system ATPase subunit